MDRAIVPPAGKDAVGDADFRTALRQIAASVAIVTVRLGDSRDGFTATAVCSVSSVPPIMLVCVNGALSAEPLIQKSGAFAINFLSHRQHVIARLFSATRLTPPERFAEGSWTSLKTGAPVLAATVASFDCTVESRIPSGSHCIYLGRVVAVTALDEDVLLYRGGSFRRLEPV